MTSERFVLAHCVVFAWLIAAAGDSARAELKPAQCAVIYNAASKESRAIAEYYAHARDIDEDHLLGIALPLGESLARSRYDKDVVPGVRHFLSGAAWGGDVRCLITCYDVPLRIYTAKVDDQGKERITELQSRLDEVATEIEKLIGEVRACDAAPTPHTTEDSPPLEAKTIWREELQQLLQTYLDEQQKLIDRHADRSWEEAQKARERTFRFVTAAEGKAGLLNRARVGSQSEPTTTAVRLKEMQERVTRRDEQIVARAKTAPTDEDFESVIPMLRESRGMFGVAHAIIDRIEAIRGDRTAASFDNELSLVLSDDYPLADWRANPLFQYGDDSSKDKSLKGIMVGRIDGPTPEIVKRMIDDAVRAERDGLKGTFYIDARGLKEDGDYVRYDRDMLDLARLVRDKTRIPVVQDMSPDVFQPGSCPNAALYCGWYSVAHYVDAFDFVPGAVAVHIASFELVSLSKADKHYWCKELLADGAAATFGATAEPYLESFPMPSRFFGLLLTGDYTLVEAFWRSNPYSSWMVAVVGDPLYNPFKNDRPLRSADVPGN